MPLSVDGAKRDHVIAYLRGDHVVTVVPRLMVKLLGTWRDTTVLLPEGWWRNRLTGVVLEGGRVAVRGMLKDFPVALLAREDGGEGQSEDMSDA